MKRHATSALQQDYARGYREGYLAALTQIQAKIEAVMPKGDTAWQQSSQVTVGAIYTMIEEMK